MRLGYACINNTLAENEIKVNRSLMKRTFQAKGIAHASGIALKNVSDLRKVIDWNIQHNMSLYRMSSDMFPWMSEYEFSDLPDIAAISKILNNIGKKVTENNLRLTFHPGPFNVLATQNKDVLTKTLKELRQHGEIMDMIGLPLSPFAKINIHIGGAYGDKTSALDRFITHYALLPETAKKRITIENDDKANMFSVRDLLRVNEQTGIPIVFDYLHHQFCTGGMTEEEALLHALGTWPEGITPIVHYSSSKKKYEDKTTVETAHADFIYQYLKRYGKKFDVMLEAKAKEKAVLKYREQYIKTTAEGKVLV
jgi:UV DNA damage endonuclease